MDADLEQRIREMILDVMDVDEPAVVPTARFIEELGAASVEMVEIIAEVENGFQMDVTDDDRAALLTVADLIELVRRSRP